MKIFQSNITSNNIVAKSKWGLINITLKRSQIYFCTTNFFNMLNMALFFNGIKNGIKELKNYNFEKENYNFIDITNRIDFPINNKKGNLSDLQNKKDNINILIINGFVSGIGDNIVGLTALKIFNEIYSKKFKSITYDSYNENIMRIYQTLNRYKLITKYLSFPQKLETLKEYDAIIDLDNIHSYYEFNNMPMIDCFLQCMNVDPKKIKDKNKKNNIIIYSNTYKDLDYIFKGIKYKNNNKFLLFQFDSSAKIRGIKKELAIDIIKKLLDKTDYNIVVLSDLNYEHPRLYKLKEFSKDLDHFIYIISQMDYCITTDTSCYHFSDGLNIPTVVLFTSINPEYRIKYYDKTKGMFLGDDYEINPLKGKFDSELPFDLEYVDNIYKNLDVDKIIKTLLSIK